MAIEQVTPNDKAPLQRRLAATDHQIDQFLCEPYGLTHDEIRIVEETCKT